MAHQLCVKNEASAHVCFVTLGTPNGDQSGKHTFLVWRGPQKLDQHSIIEERLIKEINELSSSFLPVYRHEMKQIVQVKLKLHIYLADKPEKKISWSVTGAGIRF